MSRSFFILMGYLALTALVIVTTVALVAYGQGHSYDLNHNRLVHNGLVIINTQPSGAIVNVESKSGTKKTPYHATFEAGNYRFRVTKDGFESWSKVLHVIASQVTLVEYIILLPKERPATIVDRRVEITNQTISRDHRHMAYLVPGAAGGLYTLDLNNASNHAIRLYQPTIATAEAPAEILTSVSWSDDATHLLLGSTLVSGHTIRLITANDGSQVNLTEKYHFDFTGLVFSGRDWRQLYWISPDGIRRLDAGAQTVTGILADKASELIVAGDRILYIQTSELGESIGSLDNRDRKQIIVESLVKSPSYDIKYESYQGQDLLAIVPSANGIGTLYTNIFSSDITSKVVVSNVTHIIFSTDGHLASFYSPKQIFSYDLEQSGLLSRSISTQVSYAMGSEISNLSYYDGYHLLTNQNGRLHFMEYDGQNDIDLGSIATGTTPYRVMDQRAVIETLMTSQNTALNVISFK
jgi:hypothetical protein